jgi:hypothetical protein
MGSLQTSNHVNPEEVDHWPAPEESHSVLDSLMNTDLSHNTVLPLFEKIFLLIRSSKVDLQQVILNLRTIHIKTLVPLHNLDINIHVMIIHFSNAW